MKKPADKPWDKSLRQLVRANPQAFIMWILGRGQLLGVFPEKLKPWQLEVDALLHILVDGLEMLLHIEFQTYNDATMAERMLRYNVLIHSEYCLPVLSCVIYLLPDGTIPVSPLRWTVPSGQEILQFHFGSIELGKLSAEELMRIEQPALLPLLTLTKDGATSSVVETMFSQLAQTDGTEEERRELLTVGGLIATLIFKKANPGKLTWLYRRIRTMHDFLRESPLYQDILTEGREEGLEEGLEKGLEKGREEGREEGYEAMRQTLLALVQARFPQTLWVAKALVANTHDLDILQNLILNVSLAKNLAEVQQYFFEIGEKINT